MKESLLNEAYCVNNKWNKVRLKWLILILIGISLIGDYYCYDNPESVHSLLIKKLRNQFGNNNIDSYFNKMYSVYSWPNTIFPFIGGLLIAKFGHRRMILIFGFLVMFGQMLLALGCTIQSTTVMLIGRMIFGIGGESLNTLQYVIIVKWFSPKEIGFALGLSLSLSRIGNILNDVISPIIGNSSDVSSSLWVGFSFCVLSYLAIILLIYIDWREDVLLEMKGEARVERGETFKGFSSFPKIFYCMLIFCVLMCSGILSFNYIGNSYLLLTWFRNVTSIESKNKIDIAMRLPFYMSTVFIPLIGLCVDKYGKRAYLLVISGVLGTITYILFITVTPILPLIGLGLTYSIFCGVYWPSIVLILPPKLIPIAYGLGTSILNLGLALTPIAITYIYNSSFSYEVTMVFFIVLLSLSLIIAIIILIEDIKSHSNLLNSVVKEKEPTVLACEDQEGLLKVKN